MLRALLLSSAVASACAFALRSSGLPSSTLLRHAQSSAISMTSKGRVTLVTGANKGIGKEIARKLAATPGDVLFQRLDLTDPDSIASTSKFIQDKFGRLDVLVNNAAICFNDPTLYGKVPHTPFEKQADITLRTNFFGTLSLTQTLLPLLRASSSPRIVIIASAAGRLRGSPEKINAIISEKLTVKQLEAMMSEFVRDAEAGEHVARGWPNTCYGVSKMGLIALSKVLARDEPSMMVNSVDPGYCATDQNMSQGSLTAERGARTAALLAALPPDLFFTGKHWFEEREMPWGYQ